MISRNFLNFFPNILISRNFLLDKAIWPDFYNLLCDYSNVSFDIPEYNKKHVYNWNKKLWLICHKLHSLQSEQFRDPSPPEQFRLPSSPPSSKPLDSENIIHNEFLPGHYTDLTWVKHKHSLQYALNHESLDFFRGFQLSELGMDILNTLQVKSSEKVLGFTIWSTVNGATLCFKSEICVASG